MCFINKFDLIWFDLIVWGCQLRCQLISSAGHICPIAQLHTHILSTSSHFCLLKNKSLSGAYPALMWRAAALIYSCCCCVHLSITASLHRIISFIISSASSVSARLLVTTTTSVRTPRGDSSRCCSGKTPRWKNLPVESEHQRLSDKT